MIWFCPLGDVKRFGFDTREVSRWFGFGSSGDVNMVWFCHSGDVNRFGFDTREMYTWFGFDTREMLV